MNNTQNINDSYVLIENCTIHCQTIGIDDANKMLDLHKMFFPNKKWEILLMSDIKNNFEQMFQRHLNIFSK